MVPAVPTREARLIRRRRRGRYGLLLGALSATFVVEGVATPGRWEQVALSFLLAVTLLLSLWVADVSPALMIAALILASAVFVTSVVQSLAGASDGTATRIANLLLVSLAPPATVVGVVRMVRADRQVTIAAVFGVLCLYLLIGLFFASVYGLIDRIGGEFFADAVPATLAHCLYFSFTTLTTVGYGDLTASGNLGHTLSVMEALVGQIYLVTVVAVIVSNLRRGDQDTR